MDTEDNESKIQGKDAYGKPKNKMVNTRDLKMRGTGWHEIKKERL